MSTLQRTSSCHLNLWPVLFAPCLRLGLPVASTWFLDKTFSSLIYRIPWKNREGGLGDQQGHEKAGREEYAEERYSAQEPTENPRKAQNN
eukprot:jgi/Antlo1/1613/270